MRNYVRASKGGRVLVLDSGIQTKKWLQLCHIPQYQLGLSFKGYLTYTRRHRGFTINLLMPHCDCPRVLHTHAIR